LRVFITEFFFTEKSGGPPFARNPSGVFIPVTGVTPWGGSVPEDPLFPFLFLKIFPRCIFFAGAAGAYLPESFKQFLRKRRWLIFQ